MVKSADPAEPEGPDGRWLFTLSGSGQHAPASHPPLIAQAQQVLGDDALSWAVDLGHAMASTIIAEMPAFGGGEEAFQTLRMGTESSTVRAMLLLLTDDPGVIDPSEEALEGDRDFVHRQIPLDLVLRGIRLGHSMMASALLDAAATVVDEAQRTREMKRTSALLFDYIDRFSSGMASEYLTEHDRWVTSAAAERAELVRAILDSEPVATKDASATLGYPLERYHLALVLWHDPGALANPGDLHRVASRVLAGSGCSETLVIPFGASSVWVWSSWRSQKRAPTQLDAPSESGIHVTVGTLAAGIAGFRQSHREAVQTAELVRASAPADAAPPPTFTWYADVELAVMLAQDPQLARAFVTRELGPLAADTPSAAELRETLAVYLSCDRSLAKAAELLHVARNTVAYRVKKVENSTGRSLRDRRLELECALRLAGSLGSRVLTSEG